VTRVCVFCGSSTGARSAYAEAARDLALELARRRIGLVYGGGGVGIMGVLADAALAAGVEVIGVIPRPLASRELAHPDLTDLRLVDSMHERKATYWDHLIRMLGHAIAEEFVRREYAALLLFADTPGDLLDRMLAWRPPDLPRAWLSPSQT